MATILFSEPIRLLCLAFLCIAIAAAETVWPFVGFPTERRKHYLPNLTLTGLLVASNLLLATLPTAASLWATTSGVGLCQAVPMNKGLVLLVGICGLDLGAYWAHRILHEANLGWRFHLVHHSERFVDVTTAFRQHPVESAWRIAFTALGVALWGVPLWCLAIYLTLSGINALLEHGNVALPARLDAWLRMLVVTPNMHKVHHSRAKEETNSNYANILSVWDRIFGTYRLATDAPPRYGLDGHDDPELQSVRGVLLGPLIPVAGN